MLPPAPPNAKHCPRFYGYAVSTDGVVFSCWRTNAGIGTHWKRRKTNVVHPRSGIYEQVALQRNKQPVITTVHRLMLETFRGPCPADHEARHLNGNSLDNRLDNLAWGTRQANSDDKRRHGTMQAGERNGQAKLTAAEVATIRLMRTLRDPLTIDAIAAKFGVSRSQVKRIVAGKSW